MDISFRADGGVLRLETAKFLPEGLRLGDETYPWDGVGGLGAYTDPERWPGTPRRGWTVAWTPGLPAGAGQIEVQRHVAGREPETVRIAGGVLAQGVNDATVALALASYLRDEPAARAGLGDPWRLLALTKALRGLPKHKLPREPLMGDKFDLHRAVLRAYRAAVPRRYDDRRVDTDPAPAVEAVVAATSLSPRLAAKFDADDVAERAERYVTLPPWPFGVLLP